MPSKRLTPRHITTKMSKVKDKEIILKPVRETLVSVQRNSHKAIS